MTVPVQHCVGNITARIIQGSKRLDTISWSCLSRDKYSVSNSTFNLLLFIWKILDVAKGFNKPLERYPYIFNPFNRSYTYWQIKLFNRSVISWALPWGSQPSPPLIPCWFFIHMRYERYLIYYYNNECSIYREDKVTIHERVCPLNNQITIYYYHLLINYYLYLLIIISRECLPDIVQTSTNFVKKKCRVLVIHII